MTVPFEQVHVPGRSWNEAQFHPIATYLLNYKRLLVSQYTTKPTQQENCPMFQ